MGIRMIRVDPSKNMARWYEIDLQPGLFGDCSVTRYWGRIGAQGQKLETWLTTDVEAKAVADRLGRQKASRGYKPLPSPNKQGAV